MRRLGKQINLVMYWLQDGVRVRTEHREDSRQELRAIAERGKRGRRCRWIDAENLEVEREKAKS